MQARAAVMPVRHGRWTIETVDVDEPGPNEVLVRVVASGICQTDVHARDGFFPIPCPAVYGHEGAGIVERIGAQVTTLAPGDHVIMANPSCGACPDCLQRLRDVLQQRRAAEAKRFSRRRQVGELQPRRRADLRLVLSAVVVREPHARDRAQYDPRSERRAARDPRRLSLRREHGRRCRAQRPEAAIGRRLCRVRYRHGGIRRAAGGEALRVRSDHCGRPVRRSAGARPQPRRDAHRECEAPATGRRGAPPRRQARRAILPRGGGLPGSAAGRGRGARAARNGMPGRAARAPGSTYPSRCACCSRDASCAAACRARATCSNSCRSSIALYRDGKLPIERLVTHYAHTEINDAVADMLAGRTIKAVLRVGAA